MALLLDGTMGLRNPVSNFTSRPLTIGVWMTADDSQSPTSGIVILATDTLGAAAMGLVDLSASDLLAIEEASGLDTGLAFLARTPNVPLFVLSRFISATSRRLSILDASTGAITHTVDTTSVAAVAPTTEIGLGAATDGAGGFNNGYGGSISEFWYANIDAQIGGGQIDDTLMRQLAYGGPFSVPHVAQAVREYRSFRKCTNSHMDEIGEVYAGNGLGPQTWDEFGTDCARGPHPSLPYWYVTPEQYTRNLMV